MNGSVPTGGGSVLTMAGEDNNGSGGAFPGFSAATPALWGPQTAGVSAFAARSDHTHGSPLAATLAALALLDASTMSAGTYCYVTTLKAWFKLEPSTQAVVAGVRVAALNRAAHLWIRESFSPAWWNQTTWHINPATGSDEATGASALLPLATFGEYRRRHYARWLPGTETGSVTVNIAGGNLGANDYISVYWTNGLRGGDQILTVTGTTTVVASGTIVAGGFNAQNRATGQRNTINAGFDWAAHVGRQVRVAATPTTQATVMEDLTGNVAALGEQSVNGVLGVGFTVGQAIEVFTNTTAPGVHCAGPGAPNMLFLNAIDVTAAATSQERHTGAGGILNAFNCRFIASVGTLVISANTFTPTNCSFVGPQTITVNAIWFGDLTTSVGLPAAGIVLTNPQARNHIKSHCSQGPAFTVSENGYATISGDGSGLVGVFGLGAATIGIKINIGAHFACSNMWGSGNNATSVPIQRTCGSSWSKVAEGTTNFTGLVTQGVGFRLQTGLAGGDIDVPLSALPSAISDGQQPASSNHFTGALQTAEGAAASYMACSDAPIASSALRWGFPTSEKLALRLRARVVAGALAVDTTATLYKNGVATAMTVTIAAGAAVSTKVVDSTHPILFAAGDDYDLRLDAGAAADATINVSAQVEWCG